MSKKWTDITKDNTKKLYLLAILFQESATNLGAIQGWSAVSLPRVVKKKQPPTITWVKNSYLY